MTLPPHRIGDKGQRYKAFVHTHGHEEQPPEVQGIWYSDEPPENDLRKLQEICDVHPVWHTPFIIDRQDDDRVVAGKKF